MRKVMLATPSFDGRVDVRYASALTSSVKLCMGRGVELVPVFVTNGPVETLRNDLLAMAVAVSDVADLIWIDSDIEWAPPWILRLLDHSCDVVGGTYPRKDDAGEAYVVGADPAQLVADARGLMQVNHLGCGFLRLSRTALMALWDGGAPYRIADSERRRVFEWDTSSGEPVSEDVVMCRKLRAAGFAINLDPAICCNHVGTRVWGGNFLSFVERLKLPAAA